MIVQILRDGEVIAEKTVHVRGLNYQVSESEYFDEALTDAIDDGDILPEERCEVECRFKPEEGA